MVYDVTRRATFNHLSSWLADAKNLTNPNTVGAIFCASFSFLFNSSHLCKDLQKSSVFFYVENEIERLFFHDRFPMFFHEIESFSMISKELTWN